MLFLQLDLTGWQHWLYNYCLADWKTLLELLEHEQNRLCCGATGSLNASVLTKSLCDGFSHLGRHKWHQRFTPLFEGVQHLSASGTSGCQNKNPSYSLDGWKEGRGERFKVVAGAMRAKRIVKSNSEDQNVPQLAPEISFYFPVILRTSCLRHPSAWCDLSPKTIKKKVIIQFKVVTFYEVYVQQTSRMGVQTTAEHTLVQVLLLQHRITAGAGHRIKQQMAPADLYWAESHKWESRCSFGWLSHAPRSLPNTPGQTSNHFKSFTTHHYRAWTRGGKRHGNVRDCL